MTATESTRMSNFARGIFQRTIIMNPDNPADRAMAIAVMLDQLSALQRFYDRTGRWEQDNEGLPVNCMVFCSPFTGRSYLCIADKDDNTFIDNPQEVFDIIKRMKEEDVEEFRNDPDNQIESLSDIWKDALDISDDADNDGEENDDEPES